MNIYFKFKTKEEKEELVKVVDDLLKKHFNYSKNKIISRQSLMSQNNNISCHVKNEDFIKDLESITPNFVKEVVNTAKFTKCYL